MVDIQSKEVIDKISEELKVQPSMQIPRELAKLIQLVYNVNPERLIRTRRNLISDTSSVQMFTTSSIKDTFFVGASLSIAKDAVNDSINTTMTIFPFGDTGRQVLEIRYEPTTAASNLSKDIQLSQPIKLGRGTAITITNSAATASIDVSAIIRFFEVDPL